MSYVKKSLNLALPTVGWKLGCAGICGEKQLSRNGRTKFEALPYGFPWGSCMRSIQ
jgi:hypothetical protein